MVAKKPRIVIIGAGMAGLAAANKLYKAASSNDLFELSIVEGGNRIGGRILTAEFGGDRVEVGATWIHGIGGSPVYRIAQEIEALDSDQPWERMDGFPEDPITIAEGGFEPDPSIISSISLLYKELMDFAQGKLGGEEKQSRIAVKASQSCRNNGYKERSVGSFLRCGFNLHWLSERGDRETIDDEYKDDKKWSRRSLEEGVFAMHENTERTYTSADNLFDLDFNAEREYREFPDEQITIAKGYSRVIESLASILPSGLIQLGKKVEKIKWTTTKNRETAAGEEKSPVKLHFQDGSTMVADHVIVTVSLGILKEHGPGMFRPPLPSFKTDAISRLGFGVVNKLFLQIERTQETVAPFLQMVFDQSPSATKDPKVPWWMRRTVSLCPIYKNSRVLLAWFAGKEALELESLTDPEIVSGVSSTLSSFGLEFESKSENHEKKEYNSNSHYCNGNLQDGDKELHGGLVKVFKSKWGRDPLFRGSYSYVAVGSSGEDLDIMAEPLPKTSSSCGTPPLQILFAGEATHRTHYSTTHGAYFSGIREAERLLQHYGWVSLAAATAATVDPTT